MANNKYFHCNGCLVDDPSAVGFKLCTCYHVFCDICIGRGAVKDGQCAICKTSCQLVSLDREFANHKAAVLFSNADQLFEKAVREFQQRMQQFQSVQKFQQMHYTLYVSGLQKKTSALKQQITQPPDQRYQLAIRTPARSSLDHLTPETPFDRTTVKHQIPVTSNGKIPLPSFPAKKPSPELVPNAGQFMTPMGQPLYTSRASTRGNPCQSARLRPSQPAELIDSVKQNRHLASQYSANQGQPMNPQTPKNCGQSNLIIGINTADRITMRPTSQNSQSNSLLNHAHAYQTPYPNVLVNHNRHRASNRISVGRAREDKTKKTPTVQVSPQVYQQQGYRH